MIRYTVIPGDNLTKISRRYGIPLADVIEANPQIADPNLIFPGDIVFIPNQDQPTEVDFSEVERLVTPPVEPPTKFIKGFHGKSHKSYKPFKAGQNGLGESKLEEPIPIYFGRPGDGILTAKGFEPGVDNNTMIVFGRDRTGLGEVDALKKEDRKSKSGYSDYMAAGAIDIVVGRCSPFPLNVEGKSYGPLFNTKKEVPELQIELLEGINPENNNQAFLVGHPGTIMDASRIYISQMTDVDENFDIQKSLFSTSGLSTSTQIRTPCSAIMIKSDKVRLHARQDIKIVTGGPNETVNSQGNDITNTAGGIHLMAGNKPSQQQPIPLGYNLVAALEDLSKKMDQLSGIVYSFVDSQMKYNRTLGDHYHQSPFYGIATSPSITAGPHSIETILSQFSRVSFQLVSLKRNLGKYPSKYLKTGADNYINSDYNTTN